MNIHHAVSGKHSWFAGNLHFHLQLHNIKMHVHFLQPVKCLNISTKNLCQLPLGKKAGYTLESNSPSLDQHTHTQTVTLTFLRILKDNLALPIHQSHCEEAGVPREHANSKQKIPLPLGNSKLEPSCCEATGLTCLLNLQPDGLFFYMYHPVWSS